MTLHPLCCSCCARVEELESNAREKDASIAELIETLQRTEAAKEKAK